ncbi:MAG: response regulator [Candidatus Zixiibacteriota bacterium]|nr:MAG: response regulator [candidate division Zixibacteria bacterium]
MLASLFSIVTAFLVLVTVVFLIYRLGLFWGEGVAGRYSFLSGGILLFAAASWQVVKNLTDYYQWFVEGAYPILDLSQLILFVIGAILLVIGLAFYADFWQTRREELTSRDRQLSILNNLQADAREPYQIIELLSISIKEIVSNLPDTAGAIFFVNRTQRQLVLTAAVGFTKQETALLERYPYGHNIITQAVESTEPVVSQSFDFVDAGGKTIVSKFNSCLVLPLISGTEKIGAMVLACERSRFFGRTEISYLSPVADWLAQMIKSSRLSKDLTAARRELENYISQYSGFSARILSAADSFSRSEAMTSFCSSLVGLAASKSVHLLGMKSGALNIFGGSEPLLDLSENYRTALIDAFDRKKPLIINQEATSDDGRTYIARSTLLYPVTTETEPAALLLLKDGSPFRVSEDELRELDVYGRLAVLVLRQKDIHRLDITRRKGLEKILQLLRLDPTHRFDTDPGFFLKHLAGVLPSGSIGLMFVKDDNGSFRAVDGLRVGFDQFSTLQTLPGEGTIGSAAADSQARFVLGKNKVDQELRSFDDLNRDTILKLFGEKGTPDFMAACPISRVDEVTGVLLLFMFDVNDSEKSEWHRLLTLATGLFTLRLTINDLYVVRPRDTVDSADGRVVGEAINELNNHLSAIVGSAGLAEARSDLSGEVRNHFKSIIIEAEQAAGYLKRSLGKYSAAPGESRPETVRTRTLNDAIESVLARSRISEDLYMIGGRAREINRSLSDVDQIEFSNDILQNLFEEALSRFASLAEEEDVITVVTYLKENHVYLDISRHHRNFPPVQNVAGFGHYQQSGDVIKYRPADTFLKYISDRDCYYSFDRVAPDPSYLSFKFPIKPSSAIKDTRKDKPRILAIDDQAVILDLISAMCQTTGYEVKTADNGDEGLQLALNERFDVILTDLAMPGMSGLEIAYEVRKKKPEIPIVLVTGWEVNISQERMDAAGITRVLYKPFRIEQLTDIIGNLLESRSLG